MQIKCVFVEGMPLKLTSGESVKSPLGSHVLVLLWL
jgi:hypothetical protein